MTSPGSHRLDPRAKILTLCSFKLIALKILSCSRTLTSILFYHSIHPLSHVGSNPATYIIQHVSPQSHQTLLPISYYFTVPCFCMYCVLNDYLFFPTQDQFSFCELTFRLCTSLCTIMCYLSMPHMPGDMHAGQESFLYK